MTTAKIVVVANPSAGGGKAGRLIGKADAILGSLRIEHEIMVSSSSDDLQAIARRAADDGADIVAVLGGDGTVSSAANGLLGTGAALAVVPGGTGNDFAKVIGAGRFEAAVRLLADPTTVPIDVVSVVAGDARRHFVNIAGAGFDSEVNETANGMRVKLGATGTYVAAVVRTLSRFSPANYELVIDGEPMTVDAMLAVVGNGSRYGGGMKVLPAARLNDGLLDVCIVEALGKAAFLRAFPRVFAGSHGRHPKVRMLRAKTVSIEANRPIQVYADGERVGPLPATFEILPAALPVVVGPDASGIR